jgi:hypothetical protein
LVDKIVCLFKKVWEEKQIPENCPRASLSLLERRVTPFIVLTTGDSPEVHNFKTLADHLVAKIK